ncbi:MAG: N-acetyl-gamma-glutamyl-phosphate reductase, partial [Actinobacteria bacterium]|nr:N-acetyl-gamma-glutamyl-phosphate reductase [Actinomycetota bacterium]
MLGASGYTGGEIARVLAGHPEIDVVAVGRARQAGSQWGEVQPHLIGSAELELLSIEGALSTSADVCFSCLPSGSLSG